MKVLVVASGGDAPGTNKFISILQRKYGKNLFACRDGFIGLCQNDIVPIKFFEPHKYANKAGCCIGTTRFPEFKEPKNFQKALKNAKGYDAVFVLGGNGSKKGVRELADNGVNAVFIPATIDNDVEESEYSIGFHTAVKAVCDCVKNIMPSMQAHARGVIVETMGRNCGKIAENAGQAVGADFVITQKEQLDENKIAALIKQNHRKHLPTLVIMRENICDVKALAKRLTTLAAPAETKSLTVGHLQRGSAPTKAELKYVKKFAHGAIKAVKTKQLPIAVMFSCGKTILKKI